LQNAQYLLLSCAFETFERISQDFVAAVPDLILETAGIGLDAFPLQVPVVHTIRDLGWIESSRKVLHGGEPGDQAGALETFPPGAVGPAAPSAVKAPAASAVRAPAAGAVEPAAAHTIEVHAGDIAGTIGAVHLQTAGVDKSVIKRGFQGFRPHPFRIYLLVIAHFSTGLLDIQLQKLTPASLFGEREFPIAGCHLAPGEIERQSMGMLVGGTGVQAIRHEEIPLSDESTASFSDRFLIRSPQIVAKESTEIIQVHILFILVRLGGPVSENEGVDDLLVGFPERVAQFTG
jgi:hypothetical protein